VIKKKIYVRGPVLSQSGYGVQARFALRALKSREDLFDIFIQPTAWGQTGWIWEDDDFRRWMDERITATSVLAHQKQLSPDVSLQVTIPNEFERIAPVNFGYTAGIETTKVAPVWLQKGNEMDKIIVTSNHSKTTYENTAVEATNNQTGETFPYRLQTPIEVVNYAVRTHDPEPIEGFEPTNKFNYLMISQWGPRKNFDNAIKWWVEEFIDQDVGLILKTNLRNNSIMDFEPLEAHIKALLSGYPDRKCKVNILHGDLTEGQLTWLYSHDKVKALVNIAHGEGFGLPLFEAAINGLPIVTVPWSGQLDYLVHDGKKYFTDVDFTLQPVSEQAVWDGVIQRDSLWAHAEQGSYKMKLRWLKKNWKKAKKQALELKTLVRDKLEEDKMNAKFVDAIWSVIKPQELSEEEQEWISGITNQVVNYD